MILFRNFAVPQPIRIGVWCDYGVTLTPTEGIGVFVYNLVEGLLSLDEPVEVTMLVRPGDQNLAAELVRKFPGRLRVLPEVWPIVKSSARLTNLLQAGVRFLGTLQIKLRGLERRLRYPRRNTKRHEDDLTGRFFLYSFSCLLVFLRGYLSFFTPGGLFDPVAVARRAGCDVWLIPSMRFLHRLTFPSVLVIHDLVHIHYPGAVPYHVLGELNQVVGVRAGEATLCACMSRFIRDTELLGVLRLDPSKVRVVPPAAPADFPPLSPEEGARLKPAQLTQPYLFYPAAFRSYKNHAVLVEALRLLRDQHGQDHFDIVFTGIHPVPRDLARKIDRYGMRSRVHVFRCVDRTTLAALYRSAFATIVPSLYEQGSFPIYEALYWRCPVACSRIPSLLEQCRPMGDAMIYFDPFDPTDLARTVLMIRDNRKTILDRQQAARRVLWQRTWSDAARDWLAVFKEAAALGQGTQPTRQNQAA
jgi:glycosyltransferase involved in cell wall biosynthesis